MRDLWVWVRVPLSALDRAVNALKERVASMHYAKKRDEAQRDDEAAEAIKKSLRKGSKHERGHDGP